MSDSDLRFRILRALGSHGAMSIKALTKVVPNNPDLERELKTMVRRSLVEEPFIGSYQLSKRGKKEYRELEPPVTYATTPPPEGPLLSGHLLGVEEVEMDDEESSIWDDMGGDDDDDEY